MSEQSPHLPHSSESRVVLVTGASRGIGLAVARRLAELGHVVVGTATSETGVGAIQSAVGDRGKGVVMRLEDPASVEAVYANLKDTVGMPLILVNNAGITDDNLLMRMADDAFINVIDTNVNGLFRATKPVLRGMLKARWGRIVNMSSVVARMGNAGQVNYSASKSAIEGFTRSLAQEVASRGITVNSIAPGFVATDMTSELTEEQQQAMMDRVPVGRMGTTSDIASAVEFLVSEGAGYITGETLHVNGGLYMG